MEKSPKPCTLCGKKAEPGQSKCARHLRQQRARTDNRRGSASRRGYDHAHATEFRDGVFDLWGTQCVAPRYDELDAGPVGEICGRTASHADHYPKSRRQLIAEGLDPNDPNNGRPLCEHHHNQHTGRTQGPLAKRRQR